MKIIMTLFVGMMISLNVSADAKKCTYGELRRVSVDFADQVVESYSKYLSRGIWFPNFDTDVQYVVLNGISLSQSALLEITFNEDCKFGDSKIIKDNGLLDRYIDLYIKKDGADTAEESVRQIIFRKMIESQLDKS